MLSRVGVHPLDENDGAEDGGLLTYIYYKSICGIMDICQCFTPLTETISPKQVTDPSLLLLTTSEGNIYVAQRRMIFANVSSLGAINERRRKTTLVWTTQSLVVVVLVLVLVVVLVDLVVVVVVVVANHFRK